MRAAVWMGFLIGCLGVGTPRPARAAAEECTVVVASGDTLSRIASRHGVSERALVATNPALRKNPDMLRIGQKIDVCAAKAAKKAAARPSPSSSSSSSSGGGGARCGRAGRIFMHEVGPGETLGRIAQQHGVTEAAVTQYNPGLREHPDRLRVGQELRICVERKRNRNHPLCNNETPLHVHQVVPGEHLGQIAGRYGVRRNDLIRLNARLRDDPNKLGVGQELRVCPNIAPRVRERIAYEVQPGDTIGAIARRYGLTPNELIRFQQGKLPNPNALREGQRLAVWVDGAIVSGFSEHDDDVGALAAGVQLPPGQHYVVKWKTGAWGTAKTIRAIQTAIAMYQRRRPGGPKIHVGDISKKGGGKFPPHLSHQHGRDVDVGYVLTGQYAHETRFRTANAGNFDVARNWALLKAFIDTNEVRYIFVDYHLQELLYNYARDHGVSEEVLDELMQYPRGRGRAHGLIRHWKGHVNHFHVRFRK